MEYWYAEPADRTDDAVHELNALPFHFEVHPWMRELLAPGRTLKFAAPEQAWVVDLTGDVIRWRRSDEPTAVTVTDLLLHLCKRSTDHTVAEGDTALLDYYLERVSCG